MERRRLRTAVDRRDADQHVLVRRLGVFDEDVEISVAVEYAGVEELELRLGSPASAALVEEQSVRIRRLRILVEKLHVGVSGCGV
jgi:Ribonuclease G/E